MKKALSILLIASLLLAFSACNKAPTETDPPATTGAGVVSPSNSSKAPEITTVKTPTTNNTSDAQIDTKPQQSDNTTVQTKQTNVARTTAATVESVPMTTAAQPVVTTTKEPITTQAPTTTTTKTPTATKAPITAVPTTTKVITTAKPIVTTAKPPVTTAKPQGGTIVPITVNYTLSNDSSVSGVKNTASWTTEAGVNYSKYQFMGRGEELTKEIKSKYSGYTVTYKLDGKNTTESALQSKVNLMATYTANSSKKTVTVNIDTINVRLQCDYTSLKGAQGSFIVVGFTTNLPTKFIASIGTRGSTKGEICLEGITPSGSDGTYRDKVKITIPYLTPGTYYLNFFIDSGNARFPYLMSIPIEITKGQYADSEYKLLYAGDWDLITAKGYQESLTELFYNSYPRLYARWGTGSEPKTVTFVADKGYDGVAYSSGRQVVVSVDYANGHPHDIGFFSHEITHQVQQYWFNSSWWTENMANYGGFRYFHWSDARYIQLYQDANQNDLYDWNWQPYGDGSKWFMTYLDAHWPTTKNANGSLKLGLIDTINKEIKSGSLRGQSDDPKDKNNAFNAIVKKITGYDCMEDIRVRYAQEFKAKTWDFKGFGSFTDNFLTENLKGVDNPVYPAVTEPQHGSHTAAQLTTAVTSGANLCSGASVYMASGQVNSKEAAEMLIDGNLSTKWCSTTGTVTNKAYGLDGTQQWVIIDLGAKKTFNTYTIYNTKTKENFGNMTEWEILVSNDAKTWTSADYQPSCNQDIVSFKMESQNARYVMLRVYNADQSNVGTVRLYEFRLYNK